MDQKKKKKIAEYLSKMSYRIKWKDSFLFRREIYYKLKKNKYGTERKKITKSTYPEHPENFIYRDGKIQDRCQISWPDFGVKPHGQFGCSKN